MVVKNKSLFVSAGGIGLFSILFLFLIIPSVDSLQALDGQTDNLYLHGVYTIIHQDKDGNILSYQQIENLVPNEGLECSADLLFGTAGCTGEAFFQYIAIGTSAVSPIDGDLGLGAESGTCSRVQDASPTLGSPSSGTRSITLSSIFSGASCELETFAEVGLFDASSGGNMISRTLLSFSVTLTSGSTLTVNYQVNLNN